jgi:hypothetical protein
MFYSHCLSFLLFRKGLITATLTPPFLTVPTWNVEDPLFTSVPARCALVTLSSPTSQSPHLSFSRRASLGTKLSANFNSNSGRTSLYSHKLTLFLVANLLESRWRCLHDRGTGDRVLVGSRNVAFAHRPDRFWDTPNFLAGGSSHGGKADGA